MAHWFTSHPVFFGIITFVLMWSDWLLTILQERERRAHYGEHYESYPLNTIEGHPLFQSAVRKAHLVDLRHIVPALILSIVVSFAMDYFPDQWREIFLGYIWGLYLIVDTTHIGNLLGYRFSRRGLHGKLYLHQRTGYLVQMGRYAALAAFLLILTVCSASLFIGGVAIAGITAIVRQLVFLRRVPAIPEDDAPPDQQLKRTE
jgi:hypothetical protein